MQFIFSVVSSALFVAFIGGLPFAYSVAQGEYGWSTVSLTEYLRPRLASDGRGDEGTITSRMHYRNSGGDCALSALDLGAGNVLFSVEQRGQCKEQAKDLGLDIEAPGNIFGILATANGHELGVTRQDRNRFLVTIPAGASQVELTLK